MIPSFLFHRLRCYAKKTPMVDARKIVKDLVVSFTTTPPRIHNIWPTIHSMLLQSQVPSKIYLWIPKHYKRFTDMTIEQVPAFLTNNPLVQVEFIDKDWGPATKLLPCLQKCKDQPATKIVVIDDDRVYYQHFIKDLLDYDRQHPNNALTIRGIDVIYGKKDEYIGRKITKPVDVLLGIDGYMVQPRFFDDRIFVYPDNLPSAFFEDDVWISGHLKLNGVPRIMVSSTRSKANKMNDGAKTNGLFLHENYDCVNFMQTWAYFQNANR